MELAFISPADMAVVMAIALIVFGPKRLPEVGRQLGGFVKELRKTVGQISDAVEGVHNDVRGVVLDPAPNSTWYSSDKTRSGSAADLMRPYNREDAVHSAEPVEEQAASGLVIAAEPSKAPDEQQREERASN
jgi:TatA/E family protein of Tat protein translocase